MYNIFYDASLHRSTFNESKTDAKNKKKQLYNTWNVFSHEVQKRNNIYQFILLLIS